MHTLRRSYTGLALWERAWLRNLWEEKASRLFKKIGSRRRGAPAQNRSRRRRVSQICYQKVNAMLKDLNRVFKSPRVWLTSSPKSYSSAPEEFEVRFLRSRTTAVFSRLFIASVPNLRVAANRKANTRVVGGKR